MMKTTLAVYTVCETLHTSVKSFCQQDSFRRSGVILRTIEQRLAQYHFLVNTNTGCVPVALGDRCVTAAKQEPGDLT